MSDMPQGAEHEGAGPDELPTDSRQARWTRTHTTWLIVVLALSPGGVAALFPDYWTALPAGVRMAAYVTSAVLISAACALIFHLSGDGRGRPGAQPVSRGDDS